MNKKEIIGLTGDMCSGKSTLAKYLSKNPDVDVIDSDQISKNILFDKSNQSKLIELFGNNTNKSQIAKIIFSNPEKKKELEDYIHPKVWKKIDENISNSDRKIIFVESAIIYETHSEKKFDKIILIYNSNHQQQINRIKAKHNLSDLEIQQRLNFQLPLVDKIKKADFAIDTNCTLDELKIKAEELHQSL